MSFWSTARHSAATEYGRVRAESYGRRAKAFRALGWVLLAAFVGYCWVIGH